MGSKSCLSVSESDALKKLWLAGVSLEDIRACLPRLRASSDLGLRRRAQSYGLAFYRADIGERPAEPRGEVNDVLLTKLLSNKPRRV